MEVFTFPEGRTAEDISAPKEAGIEAKDNTEVKSAHGASRQSPLGSDFQKVGVAARAGMGCEKALSF